MLNWIIDVSLRHRFLVIAVALVLAAVGSISKFGLSQVVVTFQDGTDIYFARQVVNERLGTVGLPEGIERPEMGPVSTGLGEVFHYVLTYQGYDFSSGKGERP